jgi:hypothetical protein
LECGERVYYSGFDSFTHMSFGIPKNLLKILKQIYHRSDFAGELPFEGGRISLQSQLSGIKEAADWFFDDARLPGKVGKDVRDSVSRLAHFLREIRYSNLPSECSLCSFTFNSIQIDSESSDIIELAVKSSYLIQVGERRDKNEKRIDPIFQINGILAPKWDLPIYKRGELNLTEKEVKAIFGIATTPTNTLFAEVISDRLDRYNAPFKNNSVSPLFS